MSRGHGITEAPSERIVRTLLGTEETSQILSERSLYTRLKKYLSEPDAALDPSPEVDALLSELVSHLQGAAKHRGIYQGCPFSAIERDACAAIDRSSLLYSRAAAIRSLAIRAESRLEIFWTRLLLDEVSVPDETMTPVQKIQMGSGGFPYTMNYVNMVDKEAEIIRFQLDMMNKLGDNKEQSDHAVQDRRINVAFCGSGPLPLTGLLLAALMNARVTLVDVDEEAVRLSQDLIDNWEERGIIKHQQTKVLCADGGKVRFCRDAARYGRESSSGRVTVQCDVLFVAALIPNTTKEEMSRSVSELRANGPLVVVRSAHGLTARLAYFQNRRHVMTKYLRFVGLVAPKVHDLGDGAIVDDDVRPINFFTEDILNSLEIYRWVGEGR